MCKYSFINTASHTNYIKTKRIWRNRAKTTYQGLFNTIHKIFKISTQHEQAGGQMAPGLLMLRLLLRHHLAGFLAEHIQLYGYAPHRGYVDWSFEERPSCTQANISSIQKTVNASVDSNG